MNFSKLAQYLEKLEKTASRNEITNILAELFKKASAEEIDKICYLLLGELVPAYRGIEFNLAEKMMLRVLSLAYQKSSKAVNRLYKSKGDLGDTAYALAPHKKSGQEGLMVAQVYESLFKIAEEKGKGSQERKVEGAARLLAALDPHSAKFAARIPVGKLRLGFSEATILDALSVMEKGDKSGRKEIEAAFNVTADIGEIAKLVKKTGVESLRKLAAKPGIPIRPSLAERLKDIEEIFEKAGAEVGVEQKLDGFRTQIHLWREADEKKVRLFSRNLENTTPMFPEIVAAAKRTKVKSAILDGETIGYNPQTGKFAPFQETVQRKRKYDVALFAKKIPLYIFVFDILHLNGKSLLELSFRERRTILEKILAPKSGGALQLAPHKVTRNFTVIKEELKKSLAAGLEGLVVKKLDAPYQAGSRGFHWIKLKATSALLEKLRSGAAGEGTKLPDTVDCVVMGAYRGRGKRTGFGVGGFLLGIRGTDDRYYTISRLGTGLSDEQFREARRRIEKLKAEEQPKEYVVEKETSPDIWVRPSLVAEILADEITLSPRHTAGRGKSGRGYSLRFPRLVRFRDDKNPEDATTVKEIAGMYRGQK